MKILITGSAGDIGSSFRKFARDRHEFVCFDRRPTPDVPEAVVADLSDQEALNKAAQGCDALIHLGGYRSPGPYHEIILPSNIVGTYHALEAARLAGVKRFLFASTVQVDDGYGREVKVNPDMPRKPLNNYSCSKGLGEEMARVYAAQYGLEVVCLRFGWVMLDRQSGWVVKSWWRPDPIILTERDCCEIIAHSLEKPGIRFEILHAFSRGAAAIRDLDRLPAVIGYTPQDDMGLDWERATSPVMRLIRLWRLCRYGVRRVIYYRRWRKWMKY